MSARRFARFASVVAGHADAVGSREYNLKLSQLRAGAIRGALMNLFGIKPAGIEAAGLDEERLLNRSPEVAENRCVQLINIGKSGSNEECP